jgi:hypothetical protein
MLFIYYDVCLETLSPRGEYERGDFNPSVSVFKVILNRDDTEICGVKKERENIRMKFKMKSR